MVNPHICDRCDRHFDLFDHCVCPSCGGPGSQLLPFTTKISNKPHLSILTIEILRILALFLMLPLLLSMLTLSFGTGFLEGFIDGLYIMGTIIFILTCYILVYRKYED